mmetsp:Transcript_36713/g.90658  ORF Transcript_36713/g.90658 Transcript_36713/m.90658 type:complete len:92 (+) Transcript_36713:549-824(+)
MGRIIARTWTSLRSESRDHTAALSLSTPMREHQQQQQEQRADEKNISKIAGAIMILQAAYKSCSELIFRQIFITTSIVNLLRLFITIMRCA